MSVTAVERWSWPLVLLHWATALMVICLYFLGDYMVGLDYYDPLYQAAPFWHKSFGVLAGAFVVARLFLRAFSKRPIGDLQGRAEKVVASLVHGVLYLALVLLCVSGYMISSADGRAISFFGLVSVPGVGSLFDMQEDVAGQWHEWIANGLLILVGFHTLAALKHHFVTRNNVLWRMLGINHKGRGV